ncbi:MAG: capsule assembly Wzi family protein [Gammaproteobacteria bacterium]|nr:capsule assembly Wzi family protein [Gammaproteobacteria bacterium]
MIKYLSQAFLFVALAFFLVMRVHAGPWVEVGNSGLRSDIQILADAGVIPGAVTTWPLAWGDIAGSLSTSKILEPYQMAALRRVQQAASEQMITGEVIPHARTAVASNPVEIRTFESTPREDAEIELGAQWTGDWLAVKLQGSWVDDPADNKEWRADGSYLGVTFGNWSLTASAQDRWWGPGWQGSMILSNNARPVPSVSFERVSTHPFKTKWLSWLGYWDFSMQVGQLEGERVIPDAMMFGMRLNFRPLESLEIGLSRTAQLCGEGRDCGLDTWLNMLIGKDNSGDNISKEDEPGNQQGGWDVRWSSAMFEQPFALYTQWIGEDEGGGLPAKYQGQFGAETWGGITALGTYRVYLEWSDTMCNFALYKGSDRTVPDCAYNHKIYKTGNRYHGRSIAHTFDNDASIFTLGSILTDNSNNSWLLKLGYGNLNRLRNPDQRNTVAQVKTEYREILLTHRRDIGFGEIHLGAGYDYRKNTVTGEDDGETRLFLEWSHNTY